MHATSPTRFMGTRREWLRDAASGAGIVALASLLNSTLRADDKPAATTGYTSPLIAKPTHFAPRANRVIWLFMQGGPSHLDLFDAKPDLLKHADKSLDRNTIVDGLRGGKLLPSPWKFEPHGQSGMLISELLPELGQHADKLCLLNGMFTDNPAHPQATIMMHTGAINFVRPSVGSWVLYGLGTENQDLPGFVTINANGNPGGGQNYGSAFLPASFQGTAVQAGAQPIANIRNARHSVPEQRRQLDLVQALNEDLLINDPHHSQLEGIIESYELAFRMQAAVPELIDLTEEPERVRAAYGMNDRATQDFGTQCLMARRLVEAGVRFVQVNHRGWDQHNGLRTNLPKNCRAIDRPIAALLQDLHERRLLDDTLIVWTGEFGRTPHDQNNGDGRRHNHRGFTSWLAGGGVRGGLRYGATDEIGYEAVEGRVHVHDLHATILHLLGIDHERLTYRHSGRDFRLTDVHGNVVKPIIS